MKERFFDCLPFAFLGVVVLFIAALVYCAMHTECTAWGPAWVDDYITTYIPMSDGKGGYTYAPMQQWVGRHLDPHACTRYEWR